MQSTDRTPTAAPLHRLHAARLQEGLAFRTAVRKLGFSSTEVRRQECETTDVPLSVLRRWSEALGVPVAELIEEPDVSLSPPVLKRARMVRVMKTASAIVEATASRRIKRLAQRMVDQLIEIMPELRTVTPWHKRGRRRTVHEHGAAFARCLSASMVYRADDH